LGSKLVLSKKDSFLEVEEEDVDFDPELDSEIVGIVAGCYCCSQNIHVTFAHLEESPVAQIDDTFFYIIICDQCEGDIAVLKENGIVNISYDAMWLMQENLYTELYNLSAEGDIDPEVKDEILVRVYKESEIKIENKKSIRSRGMIALDGKKNSDKN